MYRFLSKVVIIALALISLSAQAASPQVTLETTAGKIQLELNADKAPVTVENFLRYVDSGFYNDTVFHRVIAGFMIQGGGFTAAMDQKPTRAAIKNEAGNGLKNLPGTIAMARTQDPDSATAQFFINTVNNGFLDAGARGPGYAVFGKVVGGMDVVMKISRVPTTRKGMHADVPQEPVVILRAYRN
jgi:peptidyl-prolyl cis-trans isomerase A (cyclophilin A)